MMNLLNMRKVIDNREKGWIALANLPIFLGAMFIVLALVWPR